MGQRAMGMSGDPERDFARQRLLAVLGANMMGSPHPGAIGQGLHQGTLAGIDARGEWQQRQRQLAQDRIAEDVRRSQIAENEAQAQRWQQQEVTAQAKAAAEREQAQLALRSKESLLSMLRAEDPDEAAFYEGDVGASAEDIRKRIIELRSAKAKADDKADDPVPSRTVFNQFQEYRDGKWVTVAHRPESDKERLDPDRERPLSTSQVASFIEARIARDGATRDEAIREIQATYPANLLPPSFRPKEAAAAPPPRPSGVGASAAPTASAGRRTGIGASAAKAPETVTYGGQKVPLQELVEAIRDEPSPAAALQGLVSRGVPQETAKLIVGLAFSGPVASKQLTP